MEAFFKVNNIRDEEKKISYLTLSLNHRLISIKLPDLNLQTVFDVHNTDYKDYSQALTNLLSWTYVLENKERRPRVFIELVLVPESRHRRPLGGGIKDTDQRIIILR